MTFFALPHQYGAEVHVRDMHTFSDDYGCQGDGVRRYIIVPPSETTLAEWAHSCLGLESYEGLHRSGGWSPFRSAEVAVERDNGQVEHFWYKLGEDGHDFLSGSRPTDYTLHSWIDTVKTFARIALREFIRVSVGGHHAASARLISPRAVIMKMLYTEWGSATDTFVELLSQTGIEPDMLFKEVIDQGVLERYACIQRTLGVPCTRCPDHTNAHKRHGVCLAEKHGDTVALTRTLPLRIHSTHSIHAQRARIKSNGVKFAASFLASSSRSRTPR